MIKTTLIPQDADLFKKELLLSKRAERTLVFADKSVKKEIWRAQRFTLHSDLMRNIESQLSHRKDRDQIVAAEYRVIAGTTTADKPRSPKIKTVFSGKEKEPFQGKKSGCDPEGQYVVYRNVPPSLQIPGLCKKLEVEYLEWIYPFAQKLFGPLWNTNFPFPIRVELRKECPSEIYVTRDQYVTQKINELVKANKTLTPEETAKILRFEDRITGVFSQTPDPHIEIYFRQFDPEDEDLFFSWITKTLAHEVIHYLEYAWCKEKGSAPFRDPRVSEALADFSSVLYAVFRQKPYDRETAEKQYRLWKEREGSGWPYAYALYFLQSGKSRMKFSRVFSDYEDFGAIRKLCGVLEESHRTKEAYRKLTQL